MSNDAKKYLDSEGLSYFWDKIKDYVGEAVESGTSDIANKIHFVVPNEKEATEALTAAVSDVDALSPGLVIALRMPFDSVASQTLNINSLGAKPIYYRNNTTDAGVFPSGAIVLLVYETTSIGTGCFKAVYSYDGAQPDVYQGATNSANGTAGLVPSATSAERDKYLKGDGTWDNEVLVLTVDPTASNAKTFNVVVSNDSVTASAVPVTTTGNQTVGGQKTFTAGIYGGSITLASNVSTFDVSQAVCFTKTITANTTLSFSNVPADCVCCVSVILINGGNYAVTWPAGVKWTDNTMPVLTKNGTDVLTFITCTGGNVWYGATACTGVTA